MTDPSWLILDPKSSVTLEQQIHDGVQARILDGRLRAGDPLPSTRALAAVCGIARSTVTLGYDRLRAAGYIVSRPGSGARIADLPAPPRGARVGATEMREVPQPAKTLAFSPGVPDLAQFPARIWARCLATRARDLRLHDLGYGEPEGLAALRVAITEHVIRARGVLADPAQMLILPSAAHVLDLLGRVLVAENHAARRCVWMEEPGYLKARAILEAHGADIVPCPCDAEGLVVPRSPERAPALIVVTPSHQYPTGVAMSLSRRLMLLGAARRHDAVIVEDDYDSEFHYENRPIAALQGIDRHERVAYVGTFSKTLAPGLRVAYAILPDWLMARMRPVIARIGGTVPIHVQAALSDFVREGHFRAHIRRMLPQYQDRMVEIREILSSRFDVSPSQGGLQIVATCRDPQTDDNALVTALRARGIGARALSSLYADPAQRRAGILVGIGAVSDGDFKALRAALMALFP